MIKWNGKQGIANNGIEKLLLPVSLTMLVNTICGLKISFMLIILGTLIALGVMITIDYYKKQPLLYGIIGVLIVGSIIVSRYSKGKIIQWVVAAYQWFMQYDLSESHYEKNYALICLFIILLFISIVSYIVNKFLYVKVCIVFGVVVGLVYMGIMEVPLTKVNIACLIAYLFMVMTEVCHIGQYGGEKASWCLPSYLIPICLGVAIVVAMLPSHKKPLSWQWVMDCYEGAKECVQDIRAEVAFCFGGASDEFGLNFYGVEQESTLGGNIGNENQVMLQVTPLKKTHHPIYLAGNYRDTYSGQGWSSLLSEEGSSLEAYKLNTYELLYGLAQGKVNDEGEVLVEENKLTVSYEKIRTRTLFTPAQFMWIEGAEDKQVPIYKEAAITFKKRQKEGQDYEVYFLELNSESELFKERIRAIDDFSYDEAKALNEESFIEKFQKEAPQSYLLEVLKVEDLTSQLRAHRDQIYEGYTNLPKSLPERVKQLTLEITNSYDTKYDKLKAIESYLESYHYTLTPGALPEDKDFVDYFLFESKEGYCTYFATSMAVMGRVLGIPTRYVEGFYVDYSHPEKGLLLNVQADQAHAWVEAYFEGLGWIKFDPSPGYDNMNYVSWKPYHSKKETNEGQTYLEEAPLEEELLQESQLILPDGQESEGQQVRKRNVMILIKILCTIILLACGYIGFKLYAYRKFQRREDDLGQYIAQFKEVIFLLGKMNMKLQTGETLEQFKIRLQETLNTEAFLVEEMIKMYSDIRYGKCQVTSKHKQILEEFEQELFKTQSNKYSKLRIYGWKIGYRIYGYNKK